jgi:hypothetical protein
MKAMRVILLCFLAVSPIIGSAQPVNIISQGYTATNSWFGAYYYTSDFPQKQNPLFSDSGSNGGVSVDGTPYNFSHVSASPPGLPSINVQSFDMSIGALAFHYNGHAPQNGTPYNYPDQNGIYYGYSGSISSTASANWVFQPTSDNLQISLAIHQRILAPGELDQTLSVTLTDVSGSNTLLAFSSKQNSETDVFSLNAGDIYQLSISDSLRVFDKDTPIQDVTATIVPVPEPGTSILFLSGTAIVWCFRRRPHFS